MPVREKPDGWLEPERPRKPRGSVEREVGVSHSVEGSSAEGPAMARVSPIEAARQRSGMGHHDRGRRRRPLRFTLVAGAVALAVLPWALRVSEIVGSVPIDATIGTGLLLSGLTMLKAVMVVVALGALTWRLRRRASNGLRTGYFGGVWAMSFGLGLVAIHENYLTGTILFDGGVLLLAACAASDELRRRDRPSPASPATP